MFTSNNLFFLLKYSFRNSLQIIEKRSYRTVLGIETSCNNLSAAVVNENRNVLSDVTDVISSDRQIYLKFPPIKQIEYAVETALSKSNMKLQDITAFATTVKPGLRHCLLVGLNHTKKLIQGTGKPFIPIHHMEAHALVIRMLESVQFPFLVLLASGEHCEIVIVKDLKKFVLLGKCLNDPPGKILDMIARKLKLKNLPKCYTMSGNQAIEYLAKESNPTAYNFTIPLDHYMNCNFSFGGLRTQVIEKITEDEKKNNITADRIIPNVNDMCASILHSVTNQFLRQLQRAMIYCENKNLIPENKRTLVFSGDIACNEYIRSALYKLSHHTGWKFVCPPHKLCSYNGAMIAWNGMEHLNAGIGIVNDIREVATENKCPLGTDISQMVCGADIKLEVFNYLNYELNEKSPIITQHENSSVVT